MYDGHYITIKADGLLMFRHELIRFDQEPNGHFQNYVTTLLLQNVKHKALMSNPSITDVVT